MSSTIDHRSPPQPILPPQHTSNASSASSNNGSTPSNLLALPAPSTSLPVPSTSKSSAAATENKLRQTSEARAIKRSAKACNYCRRGKARCDGFDSYPCRRCRESGVECVFEGIPVEEMRQRTQKRKEEVGSPAQEILTISDPLESRLRAIEGELDLLKAQNRRVLLRLDNVDRTTTAPASYSRNSPRAGEINAMEALERRAFDVFWQHYAPLAPYISPIEDIYDKVRHRSPLLTHSIVAVASRFEENRELVESNRMEATRLIRDTLFAEAALTLDDLKGILLYSAWLGRGAPPGHSVSLALQLDLPKTLERLLASIAKPPDEAALAFDSLMPAVRIWLTLYAQDLWLSLAMGRRSMVTIDLSITNARLLLNFGALRPVDARLIAQSELVTILGIVQETFLKMPHQTVETVHVVTQANSHLDNWIKTWGEWAKGQEEASGRYVLASLTMLLQGGRFYSNTLGLRDITKPEELLPLHIPCLRTALDAAVRIQGIHPAQKIAHAAEFTLITLSTSALFLLKMIKLAPIAFSPYPSATYPAFAPNTPSLHSNSIDPSSPDVSTSTDMTSAPSIAQALEAVRHAAGLLASVPPKQLSYHNTVLAALNKLESDMAADALHGSLGNSGPSGGAGSTATLGEKRSRDDENDQQTPHRPQPPLPAPSTTLDFDFGGGVTQYNNGTALIGTVQEASVEKEGSGLGLRMDEGGLGEFTDMSIASLIGTESFWSWESTLPGEINAGLSSLLA